ATAATGSSPLSLHAALPIWLAGGRRHEHPVGGDVLDAPRARAEDEHVAHAGLVHHLLVQLADARPSGGSGGRPPGGQSLTDEERSEEHTSELQSRENLVCRL